MVCIFFSLIPISYVHPTHTIYIYIVQYWPILHIWPTVDTILAVFICHTYIIYLFQTYHISYSFVVAFVALRYNEVMRFTPHFRKLIPLLAQWRLLEGHEQEMCQRSGHFLEASLKFDGLHWVSHCFTMPKNYMFHY